MDWKKISVYISTSGPDMYAEREYLLKEVEPELRAWCQERRLDLHMVDLRYSGVASDMENNIRALRVCLENIDRCRPFFVGFVGQHRGWVPGAEDVDSGLLKEYEGLEAFLGKYSLQEIEILHGLLQPLKAGLKRPAKGILYYRSDDFQRDLLKEQPKLKPVFTNEPLKKSLFSKESRIQSDAQEAFRQEAEKQVTVVRYQARWDRSMPSPELKNYYGRDLSMGRLHDFTVISKSVKEHMIAYLKTEILNEYPERKDAVDKAPATQAEADLREQESFYRACLSKSPDVKMADELLAQMLDRPAGSRILLSARGGIGKSGFLAGYIEAASARGDREVYYRFSGAGKHAIVLTDLILSVYREMMDRAGLAEEWYPQTERELVVRWPEVLKLAGRYRPVVLVLDGLKASEYDKNTWAFEELPAEMTLLCSVKSEEADRLQEKLAAERVELMPVNDPKQRKKLIRQFMFDVLKNVDEEEMNLLLNSQGSANPLFLETAIHELRYTTNLEEWKQMASGESGISARAAFQMMFKRMEEGRNCFVAKPELEVKAFLCFLAAKRGGFSIDEFPAYFAFWAEMESKKIGSKRLREDFWTLAKQVEPFVVFDGKVCRPMQESFAEAIREYYHDSINEFHRVLAAVYYDRCDKYGDLAFRGEDPEAFREVIYHSAKGRWEWVLSLLKDPAFLIAKMKQNGLMALVEDYGKIDPRLAPKYQRICRLLWLSMPVLEQDPEQLEAQIMTRRGAEPEPVFDEMLEKLASLRKGWFLSPLQKYGHNLDDFDRLEELEEEAPGANEMLGLYQSSGSLYLFSREYSVAVSPLTLQIRKTGVPVLEYMPEVFHRKYLLHWDGKAGALMLYNLETLQNDLVRQIPREVTEKIESAWWDEKEFIVLYKSLAGKGTVRIFKMEGTEPPKAYALEKAEERFIVGGEGGAVIWEQGTADAEWRIRELMTGEELAVCPKRAGVTVRDAFYRDGHVLYIKEEMGEVSLCLYGLWEKETKLAAVAVEPAAEPVPLVEDGHEEPAENSASSELQEAVESLGVAALAAKAPAAPAEPEVRKLEAGRERILYARSSAEGLHLRGHQGNQALYQKDNGVFLICEIAEEKMSGEYALTESQIVSCRFEKNLLYAVLENGQLVVFDLAAKKMPCCAFLETPVRKMVMTGAGLVTIWNEKGELLSFQLQKKR